MALVDFIELREHAIATDVLWGWHLDSPMEGSTSNAATVEVRGWLLGRSVPAVAVEVVFEDRVIRRTSVDRIREDVAVVYPHVRQAERAGFALQLSMLGTGRNQLRLQAVLRDQRRVPLVTIETDCRWREEHEAGAPLISVVIPCYNQAHFLGEAIESVLRQSYSHIELVVVDDGSQDNTSQVAARYPGVRCLRQPNRGQAEARNTGIRQTNGGYLVFLDADDLLLPEALEAGMACLAAHAESAYSVGRFRHIDVNGVVTDVSNPRIEEQRAYYLELLRFEGHSVHHTVMYRREVLEYMHGFDPSFQECADYDLHLRTARLFLISFYNTVVAEYRRYGGGVSYNSLDMLQSMKRVFRSQRHYIKSNERYREAYRIGMRAVEELYGQPALSDLRVLVQETGWWASRRAIFGLAYFYPRGLIDLLSRRRK